MIRSNRRHHSPRRPRTLAIEPLEGRALLAQVSVINGSASHSQPVPGKINAYSFVYPDTITKARGELINAGLGVYKTTATASATVTITTLPDVDLGERAGDPIVLSFPFQSWGSMAAGDSLDYSVTSDSGGGRTALLSGRASTGSFSRYDVNPSQFKIRSKIGDQVSISFDETLSGTVGNATNYTSIYFPSIAKDSERPDIATAVPTLNPDNSVSFGYSITGTSLSSPSTVALYWSADDQFDPTTDTPTGYSVKTQTAVGTYGPIHVDATTLGTPPQGAKYLLAVADPDNAVDEADESNNIQAVEVKTKPDIAVTSLTYFVTDNGLSFSYNFEVTGSDLPEPATVALYWADAAGPIGTPIRSDTAFELRDVLFSDPIVVSASDIAPGRPANATQLVVVADRAGDITESNEDNNDKSLEVVSAPTVAIRLDPSSPKKSEVYSVFVDVTNNALIPQSFTIDLTQIPTGKAAELFEGRSILNQGIKIEPLHTESVSVDNYKYWDWIDKMNPVSSVSSVIEELYNGIEGLAWDDLLNGAGRFGGILAKAYSLYGWIDPILEAAKGVDAIPRLEFGYSVDVSADSSDNTTTKSTSAYVEVPEKFQDNLRNFTVALAAAKEFLNVGFAVLPTLPIAGEVTGWVFLYAMTSAGVSFGLARNSYAQAVDPIDPNYTEIAVPQTPRLAEVDSLPDGPLKSLATLTLELQGLSVAEATSRDRSLGAREAGDAYWESVQLIATSQFADRATSVETRIIELENLAALATESASSVSGSEVAAYLQESGFPDPLVDTLASLGWTPGEIEALRSNLVQAGADGLSVPEDIPGSQLSTLYSGVIAIEELREGIGVRVERAGAMVRDLTPEERAGLDAARNSIEEGFAEGFPSESFLKAITSYLSEARRLALDTNNIDAVLDYLDYGYGALMDFQQLDATPAGLRAYVDHLEAEGQISGGIADELRAPLSEAEQHLTDGRFYTAQRELTQFIERVQGSLSGTTADDLTVYASYISGFLEVAPLAVSQISINGGAEQRSNIESIAVQFSNGSNLQALIDDGTITNIVQVVALEGGSAITLTADRFRWSADTKSLLIDLTIDGFGGSTQTLLPDGQYSLRLRTADILAYDRTLVDTDGTDDGYMTYGFHRLFGDTDGDGDVDNLDFFRVREAVGKRAGEEGYFAFLDFDGDGDIDRTTDFVEFAKRRGKRFGL